MSDSKNLMGLNLSVDNELIAVAVRESIISGIAASLEQKDQIIHEFIKSLLSEKVLVEDGSKPRGYSSEKTCSRLEYSVRKALVEATKEEIAIMIDEQKPAFRELIRKELQKKEVQSGFVEMFMDSLKHSMTSSYSSRVSVSFEKKSNY